MNELSQRLTEALRFIVERGYAKSESEVAKELGVRPSALNMARKGKDRVPSWEMLLNLCDKYPINFWWLRAGEGEMVQSDSKRVPALLRKVARLEGEIAELRRRQGATD